MAIKVAKHDPNDFIYSKSYKVSGILLDIELISLFKDKYTNINVCVSFIIFAMDLKFGLG